MVQEHAVHEAQRLPTYELQQEDLSREYLLPSSRKGVLLSDGIYVPEVGGAFVSFRTNSDGGCALHSVCSHPSHEQKLSIPCGQSAGRGRCSEMLGETLQDLVRQLGSWHVLEQFYLAIWSELTVPAASGADASYELQKLWKTLGQECPDLQEL